MGTKFTYALILTICGAVLNLLLYFTGYQTEKLAVGQHFQWFGLIITVVVLWLGISSVRDETPERGMSYGRAVGTGTLISLFSGLMSGVYNYIHFKFINVNYVDYLIEVARAKWIASGVPDAQIEQMEAGTRMMSGPIMFAIITPFMAVIFGVIVSLVVAAFVKRPATGEVPPPM